MKNQLDYHEGFDSVNSVSEEKNFYGKIINH